MCHTLDLNTPMSPMEEKAKAILKWPSPRCTKDLRSLIAVGNFYCHFVPRFADIAVPITNWKPGSI